MLFALVATIAAQSAAPPAAVPAPPTVQAGFAAAETAEQEGRFADALALLRAIEPRVARSKRSRALVQVREGFVLTRLGRWDEARMALRSGLAALPTDEPALASDNFDARRRLAALALLEFDYPAARALLEAASRFAGTDGERMAMETEFARATMFDEGGEALGHADAALALALKGPTPNKTIVGQVRMVRGQAQLNHGDRAGAFTTLNQAVTELGGLTERVDTADLQVRGTTAIAAMLAHRPEEARRLLAYSGAGRLDDGFAMGVEMVPPPCGGEAGLRPDDVAVVEFGVAANGAVAFATPIYASRLGPVAAAFARAVRDWSWDPEAIAKMPAFFRMSSRIELRCSQAAERPSVLAMLHGDLDRWLDAQDVAPVELTSGTAAAVEPLRAELARREAVRPPLATVPVLLALGTNRVVPIDDALRWLDRARRIVDGAGAPPAALAYLALVQPLESRDGAPERSYRERLREMLAQPALARDPRTAAALRLMLAERRGAKLPPDARAMLTAVTEDQRLPQADPLRVGALVRLAAIDATEGRLDAARANWARTGLDEQQCALVDAQPAMRSSGGSYPLEALQWGFSGWAQTEFDIRADGRTANQRAIVAYPPFVFDDAAIRTMDGTRYTQSFRPAGGLGCGGQTARVRFQAGG